MVLDPGVLVSGFIAPRGVCAQILAAALAGYYGIVASPGLLDELEDVVLRPKFRRYFSTAQAHLYVARFASIAEHHPDPVIQTGLTTDPDDDYLVALAHVAGADYLVSGDAHVAGLQGNHPPVLTPRAFLETLTL